MDPSTQGSLAGLLTDIVGIILGSSIVIAMIRWLRHRGMNRCNPLFVKAILRAMTLEEGSRVIDVGCGTGWLSREAARLATEGNVVGIDISHGAVKRSRELALRDQSHIHASLVYATADAGNIPCPSDYFDCATCSVSFSWFYNPGAALTQIERTLKPGGRLYIADVCNDHMLSRMVTTLCNLASSRRENLYSAEEYRESVGQRFLVVCQERLSPLGGLLTVGTKGTTTDGSGE